MTYLSSIYYLSNVIFLFVAAYILDRFSSKKTIMVAMFLCILSTFILSHAHSFYLALLCRFITGIGSAFCFLGPVRIASRWFPPKRMALVTGAIVTMAMVGGMLSQYPLTQMVQHIGWRDSLNMIGWLGVIMLIMMGFWIKDKPSEQSEPYAKPNALHSAKQAYLNTQTIRAAFYASLMNMAVAVFGAVMGQLYLMQRLHVSQADAAMINSMLFFGSIVGGPVVGWLSDRLGRRVLPMKIGVCAALVTTLLILYVAESTLTMSLLFFFLGLFTSAQVISYAIVAESNSPKITATALSTVSILTQGGYVIYQNLFSELLQRHGGMHLVNGAPVYALGDYQAAALLLPLGLVVSLLMLIGLKETYCKHPKD